MKRKTFRTVLAVVLALIVFSSLLTVLAVSGHHCHGGNCMICSFLQAMRFALGGGVLLCGALALFLPTRLFRAPFCGTAAASPVRQKVKLNI